MKRKILTAIYVILILITIKLFYNIVVNSILISNYNRGQYSQNQAKLLTNMNFVQSYVANYNYGNILYQNGEYESAIEQYKKALNGIIPKNKECDVRINYALAICKLVQVDETNQDSINDAVAQYESAIDILTENGCANKNDDNGHNQNAEILKKDIQKEIDRLKNLLNNSDNSNGDDNKDEDNNSSDDTETIESKIQNIKEDATKEQREKENLYKYYNKNFNAFNCKNNNW